MLVSDKGLDLIKTFESFSALPYRCPAGKLTIGYGHVIKDGESFTKITQDEALEILRKDCAIAESCINKSVTVPINQNQFDALVSFVFNVGCGAFKTSTLLLLLNSEKYNEAANEFNKWVYANRIKLNGLVNRRAEERALFLQ